MSVARNALVVICGFSGAVHGWHGRADAGDNGAEDVPGFW